MLLHDLLTRRATADGSGPFLTCYGPGPERTELSARSFANWVNKTANLLVDEAGLEPGERVELRLNAAHPGHWMTLIWTMAAWQAGLAVVTTDGDVIVDGPSPDDATPGVPAYACSLHPLGLGLRTVPAGWVDFSSNALAQPDVWLGDGPDSADELAWEMAGEEYSQGDLLTRTASARRVLVVDPTSAWEAAEACLIAPLLGGGSSVVAVGLDEPATTRIATDERVDG